MDSQAPSDLQSIACDLWVPAALDEVWNFASQPKNLAEISPQHLGLQIEVKGPMVEGSEVVISFKPFGFPLPLKWVSKLSDIQSEGPHRRFVDTQLSGPFAHWKHTHIFDAGVEALHSEKSSQTIKSRQPGTWIRDRVEYKIVGGTLSSLNPLLNRVFIRRELERMFTHRSSAFSKHFRSP